MWRGCGEEQTPDHVGPEGVPAGAEEELQPSQGEPPAHAGEEDPRAVQAHQTTPGEQVNTLAWEFGRARRYVRFSLMSLRVLLLCVFIDMVATVMLQPYHVLYLCLSVLGHLITDTWYGFILCFIIHFKKCSLAFKSEMKLTVIQV